MALPTLDAVFASAADQPRRYMLSQWLVNELGSGSVADYLTLPERYLWAKIAVAAGAPKDEAFYINAPKQYAWKDIYNAVAGLIPPSNVLISGAGSEFCNGAYIHVGEENGKPKYENDDGGFIFWDGVDRWSMDGDAEDVDYEGFEDVEFPWLVTNWQASNADEPAPTATEIPQSGPNHTDWTEKQALGHIAAAYRGDTSNPANLATYIDWPWRYQVASIITQLAAEEEPIPNGNGTTFNAVIVSGSGGGEFGSNVNGTYTERGEILGKPYYNLVGEPNDPEFGTVIRAEGGAWFILNFDDGALYLGNEDVAFPWLVETWSLINGLEPLPTLTPTNV
jgi:hypothetical protein